jgi:GYF domain
LFTSALELSISRSVTVNDCRIKLNYLYKQKIFIMSSNNTGGTLRPAWNRGNSKGFQPPPQVEQQQSSRNNSKNHRNDAAEEKQNINQQTSQRDNYNKFSALDIDDDDIVLATTISGTSTSIHSNTATTTTTTTASDGATTKALTTTKSIDTKTTNSRSEGLRSSGTGRSLADLAARAPVERTASRFSSLRNSGTSTDVAPTLDHKSTAVPSSVAIEEKIIRYTRERILSLRPPPLPVANEQLKNELEGSLILSDTAQDPVCWDSFDAEKIWATVPVRRSVKDDSIPNTLGIRRAASINAGSGGPIPSIRRETSVGHRDGGGGGGRWQRGVALPPEGSTLTIGGSKQHRSSRDVGSNHHHHHGKDAENPNDLWDDPASSGDGALMDFSAFGDTGNDAFDFDKMADASKKLEEELHGTRSRASSNATNDDEIIPSKSVNPNRPLATAGTTIRSGSGDHVNVFEDFDDPGLMTEDVSGGTKITEDLNATIATTSESQETSNIKAANEDPSASSRLMAMIGVKKDESIVTDSSLTAWGQTKTVATTSIPTQPVVSLNPWGDPIIPPSSSIGAANVPVLTIPTTNEMQQHGLELQARLRQAELEQQKAEEKRRVQEELQRQRQLQEQERARALQQQQQAGVQSQVELVLMERISTILESSWGRSDLVTILSTLHAEDPRVLPLLNNIDALRALLLRNPRRVALRQDPALRIENASLLITNAQWHAQQQQQEAMQQQQQQAMHHQQQQEELQRLERQRRLEEQQAAAARLQQQQQKQQQQKIVPDAPWYYSDPSKNIQGPFRGEEMRQWLEAGYFKGDLPISQNPTGPFRPLAVIFTDLSVAFMNPKSVPSKTISERAKLEEQRNREQAERARIEAEAAERERRRAEEQRKEREVAAAAAEQKRQQQARVEVPAPIASNVEKAKNSNGANESSNQLKLMLGLGSSMELPQNNKKAAERVALQEKQHISNDESQSHPIVSPDATTPVSTAKNTAPAWGGAAVSQPVTKKSMSEIQKEEARAAAVAAMNRQSTKPSSSGWANVAAAKGGSTAWSGGVAKPQVTAAVVAAPTPISAIRRAVPSRSVSLQPSSVALSSTSNSSTVPNKSATQGQVQRASSVSEREPSTANAFGAKMDPALEKWCKDQMHKLNGTDDLTLVDFCMILTDSEEIRQYLTAYLGSTPQVNAFATEFIQRKGGNQKKNVEEWESTATVKKGKKKKVGSNAQ